MVPQATVDADASKVSVRFQEVTWTWAMGAWSG
jgi:hypothetical protein